MVMKRYQNWSPGLILGAFCTIFQARPVGTVLGAKFGRKPPRNQIKIIICITARPGVGYVLTCLVQFRARARACRYGPATGPRGPPNSSRAIRQRLCDRTHLGRPTLSEFESCTFSRSRRKGQFGSQPTPAQNAGQPPESQARPSRPPKVLFLRFPELDRFFF